MSTAASSPSDDFVLKVRKKYKTFQTTPPVIEGGEVFWATNDRGSEVNAAGLDGKLRWTTPCESSVQTVHVNQQHVIVRSTINGGVCALQWFERATGEPCGRVEVEETQFSALIGDTLFVLLRQEVHDRETRKLVERTPHSEILVFEGPGRAQPGIEAPGKCVGIYPAGELLVVAVPTEVVAYRRGGEIAWRAPGTFLASDETGVLLHHGGALILLGASDGEQIWAQPDVVPDKTWPAGGMGFGACVLADTGMVDLRCFELSTGAPRWSAPVGLPKRGFRRFATPLFLKDAVFLTDGTDRLTAFSLADGRVLDALKPRTERGLDGQGAACTEESVVALAHHGDSSAIVMIVAAGPKSKSKSKPKSKPKPKPKSKSKS